MEDKDVDLQMVMPSVIANNDLHKKGRDFFVTTVNILAVLFIGTTMVDNVVVKI